MDELTTQMEQDVNSLTKARATTINKSAGDRRRLALQMENVLGKGLLIEQGFPKPLMCWLGIDVLNIEDGDTEAVAVLGVQPCHAILKELSPDLMKPFVVEIDEDHDMGAFLQLVEGFGDRLLKNIAKCELGIKESGGDRHVAFLKMTPKEGDQTVEFHWVPPCIKSLIAVFRGFATFAAPWIFQSEKFGYRFKEAQTIYQGMGSFLLGLKGRTLTIAWPMTDTVAAKADIKEVTAMFGRLSGAQAKKFMSGAVFASVQDIVFYVLVSCEIRNPMMARLADQVNT